MFRNVFVLFFCVLVAAANAISTSTPTSTFASKARSYILLSNLQSGSNIGAVCRNALAFGVTEVIVVGRKDFKVDCFNYHVEFNSSHIHLYRTLTVLYFKNKMRGSDRGAKFRQNFAQFPSTTEAVSYLRELEPDGITILGVEITKDSQSIAKSPYTGPTAFVFGNEGE